MLRRLAWTAPARRLLTLPRVERLVAVPLRGSAVRETGRFVLRELARRRMLARYHVRESGRPVLVRTGTADVAVLDDVFYSRHYTLPEPVSAALASLERPPVALDLGANVGYFGVYFLGLFPEASVVSVEPDAANAAVLRRCVELNHSDRWTVIEAAAQDREGTVLLASGRFSTSRVEQDRTGPGTEEVPAVDVFPLLEKTDLAKVDIEGSEWGILGDARFRDTAPPVVVLEYHEHLCPGPDPKRLAIELLEQAGFAVAPTFEFDGGQGLVWAWRDSRSP